MKGKITYYHFVAYFILYFFFNLLFLPEGLLYTTLLAPLFLYWLYRKQRFRSLLGWSVLLLVPIPFQLALGVDSRSYIVSLALVAGAWIFLFTALEAVRTAGDDLEDIFLKVLAVNSVLLLVALLLLPVTPLRDLMWDSVPMSRSLPALPRLKLLAYEPSHYTLLLAPVFIFFLLKVIAGQSRHPLLLAAAVGVPLVLSFSFGVIGATLLALFLSLTVYFRRLPVPSRRLAVYSLVLLVAALTGLLIFWPENPVFIRIGNILAGSDSSSKGRLVHSFMFAKDLVLQHHAWLGVGPGQVKVLAHDMIVNYYQYSGEYAEVVRIPNSMGEMLAIYGIYGFVLKIFLEWFFFIRMKLYRNLFSLTLFLFIFIYQFTGSFLVNAAEIGTWAIVFNSRFGRFDLERLNPLQV